MTHPSSILIIGAGLLGLSCADNLVRSGAKITVLDSNRGPARQTSFANSGMIHPSQACPWNSEHLSPQQASKAARSVYALAQRSRTLIRQRASDLGLSQSDRAEGCLQIFNSEIEREDKAKLYAKDGIAFSTRNATAESFDRPALFFKEDLSGNAFEYCTALENDLKNKGVEFHYNRQVTRVSRESDNTFSIVTSDRTFKSELVVIAAGEASAKILKPLGVTLNTYSERGFAMDFKKPKSNCPETPIMDAASKSALTVFEDKVRLSGTIGANDTSTLLKAWTEIAPNLVAELGTPFQTWSANRPMSTLGRPHIGQTSIEGLWVNTGHGHMGWTLSAASGELLSDMMLDGVIDERFEI